MPVNGRGVIRLPAAPVATPRPTAAEVPKMTSRAAPVAAPAPAAAEVAWVLTAAVAWPAPAVVLPAS